MALTRPRAAQIYNLDYKQAVRAVATTNVTLSGGAPAVVDGVSLNINDRVLCTAQSTGSQNLIYVVTTVGSGSTGTWTQSYDDTAGEGTIEAGTIVMVTEGSTYADTQWKLITDNPIVIGTTALTWTQNYSANSISSGTSNVLVTSNANVTISSAGTANVLTISSTGTVVNGTESVTGNIVGGNVLTAGLISAAGNITGNYVIGNGRQLTSLYTTATTITATSVANTIFSLSNTSTAIQVFTGGASNCHVRLPDATTCTLGQSFEIINRSSQNITVDNSAGGAQGAISPNAISVTATITDTTSSTGFNLNWIGGSYTGSGQLVFAQSPQFGTIYPSAIDTGGGGTLTVAQSSATLNFGGTALTQTINFWPSATGNTTFTRTLNLATVSSISNTVINIGNTANTTVSVFAPTTFSSTVSATGNITGGNILTSGLISVTGNIYTGNILTNGYYYANGVAFGGGGGGTPGGANTQIQYNNAGTFGGSAAFTFNNTTNAITTTGTFSASGNITGGNLITAGLISATGNIATTGNINAGGYITNSTYISTNTLSAVGAVITGNVTGGNITTAGLISATGTITGSQFNGSGAGLTSIPGANVTGTVANATYATSAGSATTAGTVTTNAQPNITSVGTLSSVSSTGNITGGNILTGGLISSTGNATHGNLTVGTGTITGGNIVNANANGVGNIGSSTLYFNTVFAKATSAQYADLAEMYCADASYPPGTVVEFGGESEITITNTSHSTAVAGIISTNPSYLMNSTIACEVNALEVALVGRVPCQVVGTIRKGDRLVSGNIPGTAQALNMNLYEPGCIVGKALEDYNSNTPGVIEVAVGRI